ncbi:MAG: class I SAM-dependent methyltransferase family protein [Candidatus Lokiarchaeota archaeon]|nr:class I SAM-dependent methyltransferase family protein [Candidatus Lokiarchaeota archaeon]MBD3337466.1 class I SAM-dependent methyltransferase family protein [Candidatus Lokiarchaeota archaeon]
MGFKDLLKEKLSGTLSKKELNLLPRGFQTLGTVIVLKLKNDLLKYKRLIAEACLELYPHMDSVYINLGKIKGKFREPENIEYILGKKNPIVEHKEHGVAFKFDITKIMFSKGNLRERIYLANLVQKSEVIIDMFAGIGYFSLPIAINSEVKKIYSIELNPIAYRYLVENIKLNNVENIIIPIQGDCKEIVVQLSDEGIKADRVIMGVFPAPKEYIKDALSLVKENGTIYHYEGIVDKQEEDLLFQEFNEIAHSEGYLCELKETRFVKSVGPNLFHATLDIKVIKSIK